MIMAGGAGTRLWPMSRRDRPKQLLPFLDGRSLLEIAAARLDGVVEPDRRLVCTGEAFRSQVRDALPDFPDERILGEPVGRNTVNAVGFTAAVLAKRDPDAVFAVLTADHLIEPLDVFRRCIDLGYALVEDDPIRLVTFGITPTFASTGLGWVKRGDAVPGFDGAFRAVGFDEKPQDPAVARSHLESGVWSWNSGMFVFHAARFLEALEWFLPDAARGLAAIADAWGTGDQQHVLDEVYPTLPSISVDYAVMEPAATDERRTICCVPMDVAWRDVGSWPTYGAELAADADGCRTNAQAIHHGSRDVLAVSDDPDHLVATIGCEDLIVVATRDVTLVCPAARAQEVRDLVDRVDEARR
jgi:mannose-1-phosphate guanylyltransferase